MDESAVIFAVVGLNVIPVKLVGDIDKVIAPVPAVAVIVSVDLGIVTVVVIAGKAVVADVQIKVSNNQ